MHKFFALYGSRASSWLPLLHSATKSYNCEFWTLQDFAVKISCDQCIGNIGKSALTFNHQEESIMEDWISLVSLLIDNVFSVLQKFPFWSWGYCLNCFYEDWAHPMSPNWQKLSPPLCKYPFPHVPKQKLLLFVLDLLSEAVKSIWVSIHHTTEVPKLRVITHSWVDMGFWFGSPRNWEPKKHIQFLHLLFSTDIHSDWSVSFLMGHSVKKFGNHCYAEGSYKVFVFW